MHKNIQNQPYNWYVITDIINATRMQQASDTKAVALNNRRSVIWIQELYIQYQCLNEPTTCSNLHNAHVSLALFAHQCIVVQSKIADIWVLLQLCWQSKGDWHSRVSVRTTATYH